ncbi:MAG: D-alanyl-D-alanine carboxypeptidase family protein [Thermodesulfovibrionales bacterium]
MIRSNGQGSCFNQISFIFCLLSFVCFLSIADAHAFDLNSKAAVVIEASTGRVLYGKNPNLKLPPASTTKLMTAMVALDRLDLDETVRISEKASRVSPIKANFREGELVAVNTLLRAALIKSANDAAYALAEAVAGSEERFAELMNQKATAIGMNDTRFVNSTGLPEDGQYITAYDLARMLRHALRYTFIKEALNTRTDRIHTEDGRTIFLKNSNKLLWEDESVIGGKTGYTRLAKHCFVCASENGGESVIVAVLGSPSREALWKESEVLISKGFDILNGKEEPGILFDKADYDGFVKKASYKNKVNLRDSGIKKSDSKKTKLKKVKNKKKKRLYVSKEKTKKYLAKPAVPKKSQDISLKRSGEGIGNKG